MLSGVQYFYPFIPINKLKDKQRCKYGLLGASTVLCNFTYLWLQCTCCYIPEFKKISFLRNNFKTLYFLEKDRKPFFLNCS